MYYIVHQPARELRGRYLPITFPSRKSQGNFRYLVLSYLRLEGISNFEGNCPINHQNSHKSRTGNNKGIKYHRWLYSIYIYIHLKSSRTYK